MASYVTQNLLQNEKIIYRTHRHWVVFSPVIIWVALTTVFAVLTGVMSLATIALCVFTLISFCLALINFKMSELAVTNMRVLVKVGFISRTSLETNLQNIASIGVEQSILGRIFKYGTICIYDTGWLRSPFAYIDNPFEFRRAVQSQVDRRFPPPPSK